MRQYFIDLTKGRITFNDQRFYLSEDGETWVPSVTSILTAYPKDAAYFQWLKSVGEDADTIRDDAGRRGSAVHHLTELYDEGQEVSLLNGDGNLAFRMVEWAMFERYVEFSQRFTPSIIQSEQTYVSERLGFAGTVDRIMEINGQRLLVDIKTSNAIYPSYWLQLAAYQKAIETEGGPVTDGVAILWLNAKTRTTGSKGQIQGPGWQLVIKDDTAEDWDLFKATQKLWLAQNKDAQPKRLSYQLSHKR